MHKPPICYIAGPVTNDPDHKAKFDNAKLKLEEIGGYAVLCPTDLDAVMPMHALTHNDLMRFGIALVNMADVVCMLPGYEKSKGAMMEYAYAKALGLKIIMGDENLIKGPEATFYMTEDMRAEHVETVPSER